LCEEVQQMIITEMISTGHARALIMIEDIEQQYALAQRIFDEKLSVRDVEKLVKNLGKEIKTVEKVNDKKSNESLEIIYQEIAEKLKNTLGTKVSITAKGDGAGKIDIEFYSHDDLDRLVEKLKNA
jgi:ParB family chromosome partitioning protein